jgi:hypothetical protein
LTASANRAASPAPKEGGAEAGIYPLPAALAALMKKNAAASGIEACLKISAVRK